MSRFFLTIYWQWLGTSYLFYRFLPYPPCLAVDPLDLPPPVSRLQDRDPIAFLKLVEGSRSVYRLVPAVNVSLDYHAPPQHRFVIITNGKRAEIDYEEYQDDGIYKPQLFRQYGIDDKCYLERDKYQIKYESTDRYRIHA